MGFDDAWQAALPDALAGLATAEANSWKLVLEETAGSWRRAYVGEQVLRLNGAID